MRLAAPRNGAVDAQKAQLAVQTWLGDAGREFGARQRRPSF
jgi:hypothetical protein